MFPTGKGVLYLSSFSWLIENFQIRSRRNLYVYRLLTAEVSHLQEIFQVWVIWNDLDRVFEDNRYEFQSLLLYDLQNINELLVLSLVVNVRQK